MRRRLFAVVSAVSLLLCLSTVVLWVRSYVCLDLFEVPRPDYPDGTPASGLDVAFNEGQARLAWRRWLVFDDDEDSNRHFWRSFTGPAAERVWRLDRGLISPRNYHRFGQFSCGYEYDRGSGTGVWFFSIPLWLAFVSFTACPAWRFARSWRQQAHDERVSAYNVALRGVRTMRWRNLLILLLGHVVGSYAGAGLLVLLAKAVDHFVPSGFWVLLKAAPVAVPRLAFVYVAGLERPKLLAVLVVVLGYAAAFYVLWKVSRGFRVPESCLERGRGFEIALNHTPAADDRRQ